MSKAIDIVIGLVSNFFIFMLWVYEMIVASDIPVEIPFHDFVSISSLLVISLIIYSFYIRKTKHIQMNMLLLLIPLFLWFMSIQQALTYHYHKYDTLVSIIGFSVVLVTILQLIYGKVKNRI